MANNLNEKTVLSPYFYFNLGCLSSSLKLLPVEIEWEELTEAELLGTDCNKILKRSSFKQRLSFAIKMLNSFSASKNIVKQIKKRSFFDSMTFFHGFKYKSIPDPIAKEDSFMIAYLIFYIMSGGEYADIIWSESLLDYNKTEIGNIELIAKEEKKKIEDLCGRAVASKIEKNFNKAICEKKAGYIQRAIKNSEEVGETKIFELLFVIFFKKLRCYNIPFWLKTLQEYQLKNFSIREQESYISCNKEKTGLFAISYEGKLNKPGHNSCEDYAVARKYDDSFWLIAVADGVGSCISSSVGSREAVESLFNSINNYLTKNNLKDRILITDKEYANLLYYLKFNLIEDFYKLWEENIQKTEVFKSNPESKIRDFSTTLQFAFGCKKFIACGVLGDGTFYVKKKILNTSNSTEGGFLLNDGLSGVLRHEVLTVPNLKSNPSALVLSFFNYNEISDILISSDGVSNALGDSVFLLDNFINQLNSSSFQDSCRYLKGLTRKCSDYNETNFGSGDDSSIGYAHIE